MTDLTPQEWAKMDFAQRRAVQLNRVQKRLLTQAAQKLGLMPGRIAARGRKASDPVALLKSPSAARADFLYKNFSYDELVSLKAEIEAVMPDLVQAQVDALQKRRDALDEQIKALKAKGR